MKGHNGRILLLGCWILALTMMGRAYGDEPVNLRALHNPGSSQYDWDCLKCHGDVMQESSLNPDIPAFHPLKVSILATLAYYPEPPVVTNEICLFCHWDGVDFDRYSAANIRRDVDVEFCAMCHDQSRSPVTESFYMR